MAADQGWSSVPNWVIRSDKLHGSEKLLYIALLNRANSKGECWPSLATLEKEVGVSNRTVIRLISSLCKKGLVEKVKRTKPGIGKVSNLYRVLAFKESVASVTLAPASDNEHQSDGAICQEASDNEHHEVLPSEVLPNRSTTQERDGDVIDVDDVPDGTNQPEPLPDPFILDKRMKDWGASALPGLDLIAETKTFVAYWRHGEGKGKRKKNWYMTWQNWMRKQHKDAASGQKPKPPSNSWMDRSSY